VVPPNRAGTILVVEDDGALCDLYRIALQVAGYDVVAVQDGVDALRWLDVHLPSLVVLDLGLPRLSGEDVLRELRVRADTRNVPIVIVTGHDVVDLNEDELVCVLRKPITTDALVTAVRNCLAVT
jgi:DNA-binding response OmpR family regulator